MRCRVLAATAVVCVFLLASAQAAGAQVGGGDQGHGRRINVTGGLVVATGESVRGPAVSANGPARIDGRVNGAVYVGRGDLLISGRVTGDALVLDGDAFISGRVDGSVTVLNGKATVLRGADVRGDVASRTAPTAARNTVRGHVQRLDVNSLFAGFVVVILAVLWVAVTLSTAVLGLLFVWLFPRGADAVVVAGRRIWASFFLGLFFGVLAPILGLVIIASVVGIPLGVAVLGTLAVLIPLGYVASAADLRTAHGARERDERAARRVLRRIRDPALRRPRARPRVRHRVLLLHLRVRRSHHRRLARRPTHIRRRRIAAGVRGHAAAGVRGAVGARLVPAAEAPGTEEQRQQFPRPASTREEGCHARQGERHEAIDRHEAAAGNSQEDRSAQDHGEEAHHAREGGSTQTHGEEEASRARPTLRARTP